MTTTRTSLFTSCTNLVERVECQAPIRGMSREEYSPDFQIAFPCRGAFIWHVGGDAVVSDPNQVLFVRGGEPFRVGETRAQGFAELIITPDVATMRDAAETAGFELEHHPLFAARSCRVTPTLRRLCMQFLHRSQDEGLADLQASEMVFRLLMVALRLSPPPRVQSPQTRRLIRRSKEFLDENFRGRLQLTDVASAVGASPAYLTDVFRRSEGVPLHGYLTQLRLGRALLDLPHTEDLTALALDLGFSSHSHFTFAFRRLFGCTPSEFRRSTRRTTRTGEHHLSCVAIECRLSASSSD
jgi:AraC family transcriptional regulator